MNMSDRAPAMDDATLKVGLLMESAQAHQKSVEEQLEKLRAHTEDLDGVVRDEIRRTMIEELQMLSAESKRATDALQRLKRAASLRGILWSILTAVLSTGIPISVIRWTQPSRTEIAALRLRRDELAASVATLESRGGRIDWRRCGATARLCVRVDRGAPTYGEKADYYVVAGY
ncbi:MAG: hypothetical protein ABJD53_05425 [Gammaproteobacteria bacterium]